MVHIEKDQPLKDRPEFLVYDETGDYDEGDLITVYNSGDPNREPYCKYEAKYVVNGQSVYTENVENNQ